VPDDVGGLPFLDLMVSLDPEILDHDVPRVTQKSTTLIIKL
jgi:hypothetical protein